eukprot:gnl/TRDRNA2_/TRDRNA2_35286_c0_seq1.p1 gnl/TRDRNA2_/TRDRNA2_35286_c0~~gnl/TRDRNA2_/TRDRNA2_35286_c0_seq1.p1  ORF type:complete len:355 (-),score=46.50 gnl/TRDRNA2_/TRDRNA2_35286_c0_seq1:326-1390(-)
MPPLSRSHAATSLVIDCDAAEVTTGRTATDAAAPMMRLGDDELSLVVTFAGAANGSLAVELRQVCRRCFSAVVSHRAAFCGPVQAWREVAIRELEEWKANQAACGGNASPVTFTAAAGVSGPSTPLWRHTQVLVRRLDSLRVLNAWLAAQSRESPDACDEEASTASASSRASESMRQICARREAAELRRRVALVNATASEIRERLSAAGDRSEVTWFAWADAAAQIADVPFTADSVARPAGRLARKSQCRPRVDLASAARAAAPDSPDADTRGRCLVAWRARARQARRNCAAWRWAAELLRGDGSLAPLSARAQRIEGSCTMDGIRVSHMQAAKAADRGIDVRQHPRSPCAGGA